MVFLFAPGFVAAQTAWNATDYTLYDTITIDATNIDDDLTDFPVYVDLSDLSARFWSTTPSGAATVGTDIRVTTDAGSPVELPRELVSASSTLETGELHFKADSISSTTDTVFRIYYNGTTTGDYATDATYGAQNVWTNQYLAVYHMDSVNPSDSTSYSKDGVQSGTLGLDSFMGTALDFDGTAYVNLQDTLSELTGESSLTLSTWVNIDEDSADDWIFSRGRTNSTASVLLLWDNITGTTGNDTYTLNLNDATFGNNRVDGATGAAIGGQWQYVTGVINGSTKRMYIDGSLSNTNTGGASTIASNSNNAAIGSWNASGYGGSIDEFRIATSARSAAWISAEHLNQSTTTDFYSTEAAGPTSWNATDWTEYDTITIDATNIDDDLTDFPVYVDLADLSDSFWSTTPSSAVYVGTDIRVTTDDGSPVELPRELVSASSTAQTGELHFKADSISSTTDTVFRIYYNGSTAGDYLPTFTNGAQNVWTNGYAGVWHMEEDPGAGDITNSVGTGDAAPNGGMDSNDIVSSQLGRGIDFDGSNDNLQAYITVPTGDYTHSAWFDPTSVSDEVITMASNGSGNNEFIFRVRSGNINTFVDSTNRVTGSGADISASGGYYFLATTREGSAVTQYENATVDGTATEGGVMSFSTCPLIIGADIDSGCTGGLGNLASGVIDEVRVANISRSAAWLSAEYLNQATTTDFYTTGTASPEVGPIVAETWNATDWTEYDTITIDATNIDDDLTDFPVYVDLADLSASFWSTTPSPAATVGTDIRVTTDDGSPTELPRELVSASSTAQTGELHFKADSISSTTDTVFRIWYNGSTAGDYATTSTYGAQNVWSNGYVGVWHDAATTNSTAVSLPGTVASSTLTEGDVTGKVGVATDYDGSAYVDFGTPSELDFDDVPFTICAWSNVDTGSFQPIVSKGDEQYKLNHVGGPRTEFKVGGSFVFGPFQSYLNTWLYLCGTTDTSLMRLYENGSGVATTTPGTATSTLPVYFGRNSENLDRTYNGQIDEIRISSTTRSAAWISAEYLNQSTTTDFYATSSVSIAAGTTTITNADAGQVENALDFRNKNDEPLFTFKLGVEGENATATDLTLDYIDIDGIENGEITDVTLYIDENDDGELDGGDTLIEVGTTNFTATTGSTTFTTDILLGTTTDVNYLVTGDATSIDRGDRFTITLTAAGLPAVGEVSDLTTNYSESVSSVTHFRSSGGGGSGSNNFTTLGTLGQGVRTGGTNDGGQELGGIPNFNIPSTTGGPHNEWTNGENVKVSDGAYASEDTAGERLSVSDLGYNIPSGNDVVGIEVKLEASAVAGTGTIAVALSWDGGTSITAIQATPELTNTDTIYTLGGQTDTWGRSWSIADFSNTNFRVRLIGQPDNNTVQVDAISVRVYYEIGGGSSGGGSGGEI